MYLHRKQQHFSNTCDLKIGARPGWWSKKDPWNLIIACFKFLVKQCLESDLSKRRSPQEFVRAFQNWNNVLDVWAIDHTVVTSTQTKVETPHEENRPTRSRSSTNICNSFPAFLHLNVKKHTFTLEILTKIKNNCRICSRWYRIHPKCIKNIQRNATNHPLTGNCVVFQFKISWLFYTFTIFINKNVTSVNIYTVTMKITIRIILEWLYFDFGRNNSSLYKHHWTSAVLKLNCSRFAGLWLYSITFGSGMSSSVFWQNLVN